MERAAALIEEDTLPLPDPALGEIPVGAKFRRRGREVRTADDPVEGRLADELVKLVLVEGHIRPVKRRPRLLHPEGVVQGQRVGDAQKALQILAAESAQQLLDVFPVLGRLPPLQEGGERIFSAVCREADGARAGQPLPDSYFRLVKRILPTGEG